MMPLTHEASHAVVMLSFGLPVDELHVSRDGSGYCQPRDRYPDDEAEIVSTLAGGVGDRMLSTGNFPMSDADREQADRAGERLMQAHGVVWTNHARREFLRRTEGRVWQHRREILFLASALGDRGTLRFDDIGCLCREPCSLLSQFSDLYPLSHAMLAVLHPAARKVAPRLSDDDEFTRALDRHFGPSKAASKPTRAGTRWRTVVRTPGGSILT